MYANCAIVRWRVSNHRKVGARSLALDVLCCDWDNYDIMPFGSDKVLLPYMKLVTEALCVRYSSILEASNRKVQPARVLNSQFNHQQRLSSRWPEVASTAKLLCASHAVYL